MPAAFSWSRAQTIHGVESSATLLRSRWPPPIVHQPSEASPTTLVPTLLDCLHTDGVKRYFADSFMPFCAASVMSCEQGVPAVIEMNTSGSVAARLVISVGRVGCLCFDRLGDVLDLFLLRRLRQEGLERRVVVHAEVVVHHQGGDLHVPARELVEVLFEEAAPQDGLGVVGEDASGGPRVIDRIAPRRMPGSCEQVWDAAGVDVVVGLHRALACPASRW